jgi:hypothetical protein
MTTDGLNPDIVKRQTEMDQPCQSCGHVRRLHEVVPACAVVHIGPCAMSGCRCPGFVFSGDRS